MNTRMLPYSTGPHQEAKKFRNEANFIIAVEAVE
jgi:hypothetical protein